jgi:hypothetical protein
MRDTLARLEVELFDTRVAVVASAPTSTRGLRR